MSKTLIENALLAIRRRFMNSVTQYFPKDSAEYDIALYRAKMVFDNTVQGGKNFRSGLALAAFDALQPSADISTREIVAEASAVLEMTQAYYLIADDIMDQSTTRRGKPCWYKQPNIGLSAINDAYMIEAFSEDILRQLYPAHPQIDRICEAYRRSKKTTIMGQLLDCASQRNVDYFTWDRYEKLVQHKTSHYTMFHPVEQSLLICDTLCDHPVVRQIAYQLGFLFQAQLGIFLP